MFGVGRWAFAFRMRSMRLGQISVIDWLDGSSINFFHIAAAAGSNRGARAEALVLGQASRLDRPRVRWCRKRAPAR